PNRVLGQWSFTKADTDYIEAPLPTLVHATERRRSQSNLQRRVENFSSSACFLWYSGNSQKNAKASVMLYAAQGRETCGWFVSFPRRERWNVHGTKGISRSEVQQLLAVV